MKKNREVMDIDSSHLAILTERLGGSSNKIGLFVEDTETNFGPVKKTGMLNKNVSQVQKGYLEVQESIKGYIKVLNDYYTDLETLEKKLSKVVEGIRVPEDYKLNKNYFVSAAAKVQLSKDDGRSINPDNEKTVTDEINIGEGIEKENLNNITQEETKNVEYDDRSNIKQENLENIEKDNDLDVKQIDETSVIEGKENLGDIKTDGNTEIQDVIDEYKIEKQEDLEAFGDDDKKEVNINKEDNNEIESK